MADIPSAVRRLRFARAASLVTMIFSAIGAVLSAASDHASKFGIAASALVCVLSAVNYFWLFPRAIVNTEKLAVS